MIKVKILLLLLVSGIFNVSFSQETKTKWWNPETASFPVMEGRGWHKGLKSFYDRLPAAAEGKVRNDVWGLSRYATGLMIRFRATTSEIKVRYMVGGEQGLPHMPPTGVSGVDLYAVSSEGAMRWCAGQFDFRDTITYNFHGLEANDSYHKLGREYRLFLPLYNDIKWLEIGVPENAVFTPLPVRPDKPVVVYGTSIAQGACASRPGMAWTAILGRKLDRPLINLGFSGNGRLEKEVVAFVNEIDAKIFILDCLPNLTIRLHKDEDYTAEDVYQRILTTVRSLKQKHPQTPVVLASHAGYTDDGINPQSKRFYTEANETLIKAFATLKSEGINGLFIIPKADFNQDIETMVDGTHPTDLGMMRYAEGYERHLRRILHEENGTVSTTQPVTQLRELANYDWELRHAEILERTGKTPPATIVIGNSITHFWGGLSKGPVARSDDSWKDTFGASSLNLGFGWDRIENVLWRVYHGELDGYSAKQIFVNIGTNNLQLNSDDEIVAGWESLITSMQYRQPQAQITMMGIYPRRQQEKRVSGLNERLLELTGRLNVRFLDPGRVFLQKDGTIDESLFTDGLHPNAKGYTMLGAAIKPFTK